MSLNQFLDLAFDLGELALRARGARIALHSNAVHLPRELVAELSEQIHRLPALANGQRVRRLIDSSRASGCRYAACSRLDPQPSCSAARGDLRSGARAL